MPAPSNVRDLVIAISPCATLGPSPHIAAQAWRGGGLGVLDLAEGGWRSLQALAQAASWSEVPTAIRVPAACAAAPDEVRRSGAGRVGLTILTADAPWDIAETASWSRVLVEVTSHAEARTAAAQGAHGLIARGMESGGRVSDLSTFVLLQQLLADAELTLPVWAAGGIGPRTAAACVIAGAAGVVLDSQLGLMPESDLPGDAMRVLRRMDGSETVMASGWRGIQVTGSPMRLAGPRDADTTLLPIGQDGCQAAPFASRWRDTATAMAGVRSAIVDAVRDGEASRLLAPGAPLAVDLGTRLPVAQGPMTRVSDQAGFAAAVAADGALPFLALALSDGERSLRMLREAAAALDGRPWGVGVLGFVPEELRAAQLEAILEVRPSCAIIAGGRPAQAKELEEAGISTFLHVPSPGLLRQFLGSGSRRFVFEGAECGGHIGPRASFALWETQLAVIEEFLDSAPPETASQVHVLFAGGIHDSRSAAMVAAMAGPLTRRGTRIGVLMGTAYLFTREAVQHKAIKPLFQRMAVEATGTALLETAPGHVTRALSSAYVEEFGRQRAALRGSGLENQEIWAQLELLNTGRLRVASKGREHDGTELDEAAQAAEGLFMAGQVAVLRDAVTTVPELHAEVTAGSREFHEARTAELRKLLAPTAGDEVDAPATPLDIAVVGMACTFAGSPGKDGFWRTILSGQSAFREVSPERWDPAIYYTPDLDDCRSGRQTVSKWGGFLDPIPIDPIRYGIPPAALGSIDPSQLLALEIADQALIDAGYPYDAPGTDHSRTGVVFAAEAGSDNGGALAMRALLPAYLGEVPPRFDEQLPAFTEDTFPGNLPNVVAGRIANRFDLGGPNFTVDAACAASLAALDVACKQLTTGTSDLMLCGAVDLHNAIGDFLMFGSVYALSPSGKVASFDSAADGTALGEGVACVALKRLADAERDGDQIYAVIKGVGAASDGRARSLTAPRVAGQVRAMRRAYGQAGISPAEVGVIEAHGTGTVLGDQVELESLTEVFAQAGARPGGCVLGSVKSQIGHAKCAAGLAGLIKAVLAVHTGVQPPTSNLTSPNHAWDADSSPFAFLTQPRPWVAPAAKRIAGLSAFGFGGTNFHVILTGHPGTPEPRHALAEWPAELFCFRGRDRDAAHQAVRNLAGALAAATALPGGPRLRDLAARAATGSEASAGKVWAAVVARDTSELAVLLQRVLAGEHDPAAGLVQPPPGELAQPPRPPAVAFLFPGQGSQRAGALAELFVAFPELRQYLQIGQRWTGKLFPPAAFDPARERQQADMVRDTSTAQPILGMCGLAASHLLGRLGITPDMSGGHSYGELVALSTAGAFDPQTLLDLSAARAEAILSAAGEDPGAMAAVAGTPDQAAAVLAGHGLAGEVTLANINGPEQVVISGPTPAIDSALTVLREAGLTVRRLPVACAFHSPVVAAASELFAEALAGRQVSAPRLPVWSNRTAGPYPDDPGLIRTELAAQISAPVRFSDQVEAMYASGARVFIEAGPGQVLTGLVRAVLGDRPHLAVACDGPRGQGLRGFLTALGEIACSGATLNLSWLFRGRNTEGPVATVTRERPRWTANGQLIRDSNGDCPRGGLTPARLIKEFSMSSPGVSAASSADLGVMLAEYLRASREMVAAQRDVMLTALGGQPGGRLVWQQEGVALPASYASPQTALLTEGEPAAAVVTQGSITQGSITQGSITRDAEPAAGPDGAMPLSGPELQDALIALISERTGYPVELIEPDLDLEADLSIDSIKRAEIAAELAKKLGMSVEADGPESAEAAFEDLVRARTLRAIMDQLATMAGQAATDGHAAATGAVAIEAAATGAVAIDAPAIEAVATGTVPRRLVSRPVSLDGARRSAPSVDGARIVITGESPVAGQLADRLRELGARVSVTAHGEATADDVRGADGLLLLDGIAGAPAPLPPALFPLIKTVLTSEVATATGQRTLLAAGYQDRTEAAGLTGLFRSIAAEYPGRAARYVELDRTSAEDTAGLLLAELGDLLAGVREPAVTYAEGDRYRFELTAAALKHDAQNGVSPANAGPAEARALGLNRDSVVLLIGGARGITAWFARELAAASGCRIELVGRTQLPGDPLPPEVEAAPDAVAVRAALARQGLRVPAEIERATRDIMARREVDATMAEMRDLGARVRYHCADVLDEEAISQVVKLVHEEHGRIDGLVYAAGVVEDKLIADKDPESFARVFHTKVSGASVTLATLREQQCEPRFVVLYGSIAAVLGNRGQADYAAANNALEAVGAAWASTTGHRCLTVHWGPWTPAGAHPGMVTPELGREYARRGVATIDPRQGASSLLRELAWGNPELTSVTYAASVPLVG